MFLFHFEISIFHWDLFNKCLLFVGRKRNGTAPSHFCKSSTSVARKVLQSLEGLKLVEKDPNGGRRLTAQGRKDLDRIAAQVKDKSSKIPKLL